MKGKTSDVLRGFDVVSYSCAGVGSERKGTGSPTPGRRVSPAATNAAEKATELSVQGPRDWKSAGG